MKRENNNKSHKNKNLKEQYPIKVNNEKENNNKPYKNIILKNQKNNILLRVNNTKRKQ